MRGGGQIHHRLDRLGTAYEMKRGSSSLKGTHCIFRRSSGSCSSLVPLFHTSFQSIWVVLGRSFIFGKFRLDSSEIGGLFLPTPIASRPFIMLLKGKHVAWSKKAKEHAMTSGGNEGSGWERHPTECLADRAMLSRIGTYAVVGALADSVNNKTLSFAFAFDKWDVVMRLINAVGDLDRKV